MFHGSLYADAGGRCHRVAASGCWNLSHEALEATVS